MGKFPVCADCGHEDIKHLFGRSLCIDSDCECDTFIHALDGEQE